MEKIPEEIWEMIFEPTLIECPRKLFEMQTVSKLFRDVIHQYVSNPLPWLKACERIPHNVLDAIVRTKFPLNAWSWHEDYWKKSQSHKMPATIYMIWKNSECKFKQRKINKLSLLDNRIYVQEIAINDRYLALVSGGTWSLSDVYVYALSNIEDCIRHYEISCDRIDFYSTKNQDFLILQEITYSNTQKQILDVHLAEFLKNEKLRDSNLMDKSFRFGPMNRYMVVENECFTISESIVRHKVLGKTGFHTSSKLSLPRSNYRVNNIRISGSELQILAVIMLDDGINFMSIFRFKISRADTGELSLSPETENFCTKIYPEIPKYPAFIAFYNDMCDGPFLNTPVNARSIDARQWRVRNFCNRRILFNQTLSDWFKDIYDCENRAAVLHGNDLFVGTSDERVMMFKWNPDELIGAMTRRRHPQVWTEKIDLIPASGFHSSVQWIRIKYIGSKLMMVAQTLDSIFTVVFTPKD